MRIRPAHAILSNDKTEHLMPGDAIEIIADDNRTLLTITQKEDGSLRIKAGGCCKHNGILLDDAITIAPESSNCIILRRIPYTSTL